MKFPEVAVASSGKFWPIMKRAARPGFATDPNQPGVIATSYGLFDPDPTPGEKIVPRNCGRGPGEFAVNLRLSRTFAYREHKNITLSVSRGIC
jgi:hypothetical protein